MVKLTFNASDKVFASAFEHSQLGAFTIVLINSSDKIMKVDLSGAGIPNEYDFYVTTSAASVNCKKSDEVVTRDNIVLPPSSVVTLVDGNVFE